MLHQMISFVKSAIRIAGYVGLGYAAAALSPHVLVASAIVLIASELVGVWEEIGH